VLDAKILSMSDASPKKSLGQHWLHDEASLQAMCDAAGGVSSSETILEIGPGLGTLTELLVSQARHVVAVEFDKDLAAQLPRRVSADNLDVVQQDILSFDLTQLEPGYKVIANIPYYLTSNLIRTLSESTNPPSVAVLLVQKEVARRVAAAPGAMSLLTVTAQMYWEVSLGRGIGAALFTPPPKVDSQILILHHRPKPLFPDCDYQALFRIVKAGFSQRRKTLLNSLSAGMQRSREDTLAVLERAEIDPTTRAQNLSLEQWHTLYECLGQ
jgi:16S rRNA (adenine1518-N6/adenine1519-N6)-dimethyltransferase